MSDRPGARVLRGRRNLFNVLFLRKRSMVLVIRPRESGENQRYMTGLPRGPRRSGKVPAMASLNARATVAEADPLVNRREPESIWCMPVRIPASCRRAYASATDDYEEPGRKLASMLSCLPPDDIDFTHWSDRVAELARLAAEEHDEAVIAWLKRWLPRCLAPVPTSSYRSFLRGIYRYATDCDITKV